LVIAGNQFSSQGKTALPVASSIAGTPQRSIELALGQHVVVSPDASGPSMWWMILTVKHGDRNQPEYPGSANHPGAGQDRGKRGYPLKMRMDNPELVSRALAQWAEKMACSSNLLKRVNPQNAFIERLNRTYRTEILDFYLFRTLNEAREITERLLMEYNNRPHESLT
jgi:hypothetical protein